MSDGELKTSVFNSGLARGSTHMTSNEGKSDTSKQTHPILFSDNSCAEAIDLTQGRCWEEGVNYSAADPIDCEDALNPDLSTGWIPAGSSDTLFIDLPLARTYYISSVVLQRSVESGSIYFRFRLLQRLPLSA